MTRDLSVASKVVEGHELGAGRIAESGSDLLGFVLNFRDFRGRGPRSASEVLGLGCESVASWSRRCSEGSYHESVYWSVNHDFSVPG